MQTGGGALVKGFLFGGVAGAAVVAGLAHFNNPARGAADPTTSLVSSPEDLSAYKYISMDGALVANLHEPLAVFRPLDPTTTTSFLAAFDEVARVYFLCRQGSGRPSLLADALKAKRTATSHLLALTRKARQSKPLAASDLSQDLEALKQSLGDYIYNTTQEQGLHLPSS